MTRNEAYTPTEALKGALDILRALDNCPIWIVRLLYQGTGIERSRVKRAMARIEMALNGLEEEKMKYQDIDETTPNYRRGISREREQ